MQKKILRIPLKEWTFPWVANVAFKQHTEKRKLQEQKKLLSCLTSILSNIHISQNKAENLLASIDHFKSNKFGRKFSYHLLSA